MRKFLKKFLELEAASSIVLMATTVLALIAANSPLAPYYMKMHSPLANIIINDGLMAIFFLVIGIEIKAATVEGHLSTRKQAILPVVAATGGVIAPALIYLYLNRQSDTMHGWAIPSATDIAFSLGILSFFNKRVPAALRIFLMAVAVIDDLMAVIIIATFYTATLDIVALSVALVCVALLDVYRRKGISNLLPYLFAGAALWCALLAAGIHPTIAGVLLGAIMPLALGKRLVDYLHKWVAYGIVPLFAFANAGITLAGLSLSYVTHSVTSGIMAGLFIGKPVGICAASWLLIRMKMARLPEGVNWLQFISVAMIAGIGFTMSLFIGALAFHTEEHMLYTRIGVVLGSLASAIAGTICLALSVSPKRSRTKEA